MLSLSNLQYWLMDVKLHTIFDDLRIPCDLLIVPCFYLFINSYLKSKNPIKLIVLLVVPFLISSFFCLIFYFKIILNNDFVRTISIVLESFSMMFNLYLIIVIILKIRIYEKVNQQYEKSKVKVETKWLKQILYIGASMCVFWFVEILFMQSKYNSGGLSIYYPLWISISFLLYWISYLGIFNSKIYNERIIIRRASLSNDSEKIKSFLIESDNKKFKVNEDLFLSIINWIKDKKIYLNPNLNLSYISSEFNISNGYLSQLISKHSSFNFNDYINQLRVEEAMRLIEDKTFINYTIIAIGLESGFNSRSTFYAAFKKFTNKTPIEYQKCVRNN